MAVGDGKKLYVAVVGREQGGDEVVVYDIGASPGVLPERRISHVAGPGSLALDSLDNLYVTNFAASNVRVFDPTADGVAAPIRTLNMSGALAIDSADNLYLLNYTQVRVFSQGAAGTATPVRILDVTQPIVGLPGAIAIDHYDNLYVAEDLYQVQKDIIRVFHPGANGNAVPFRTFKTNEFSGNMDFDANNSLYLGESSGVEVFDKAARIRKITGSTTGILPNGWCVAVDPDGVVYVGSYAYDPNTEIVSDCRVTAYAPGADGDVAPIRTINLDGIPYAMAINKRRLLRVPNNLIGLIGDMVVTLERSTLAMASAGVRFWPSGVPVPIEPYPRLLARLSHEARRDMLMAIAINEMASSVHDVEARRGLEQTALNMIRGALHQLSPANAPRE